MARPGSANYGLDTGGASCYLRPRLLVWPTFATAQEAAAASPHLGSHASPGDGSDPRARQKVVQGLAVLSTGDGLPQDREGAQQQPLLPSQKHDDGQDEPKRQHQHEAKGRIGAQPGQGSQDAIPQQEPEESRRPAVTVVDLQAKQRAAQGLAVP